MSTVASIFFSPGAAFRKLKEKPGWVLPLVILCIVLIAGAIIATSKMDYAALKEKAAEQMRTQGLTEEQIQQRMDASDRLMGNPVMKYVVPVVSVLIFTAVGLLIVAGVLQLMASLLGVAAARYSLNLAVVAHAALIRIIPIVVRAVIALVSGQVTTSFSLAVLAPKLGTGYLANVLGRIDIFTIWEVILLAMGVKIVYELKDNRSYYYLFGLWLAYNLLFALLPGFAMRAR